MADHDHSEQLERLRGKAADFLRRHPGPAGSATFAPYPDPPKPTGCARPISGKSFTTSHYSCIWCSAEKPHAIRRPVTAVSWFRHQGILEPTCADVMAKLP